MVNGRNFLHTKKLQLITAHLFKHDQIYLVECTNQYKSQFQVKIIHGYYISLDKRQIVSNKCCRNYKRFVVDSKMIPEFNKNGCVLLSVPKARVSQIDVQNKRKKNAKNIDDFVCIRMSASVSVGYYIDRAYRIHLLSVCAFSKSLRKSPSFHKLLSIAILWCHRCRYFVLSENKWEKETH